MLVGEKKLDPNILESGVYDLIETTKVKIASLSEEIAAIKGNIEQIESVCQKVQLDIDQTATQLAEINEKIKVALEEEKNLLQKREQKQQELLDKKKLLSTELDNTEYRNNEIRAKVKKLAEDEKILKESSEIESAMNKKKFAATKRNIGKLQEQISLKNNELQKLKAEWGKLAEKEELRLQALENEKKKLEEFLSQQ